MSTSPLSTPLVAGWAKADQVRLKMVKIERKYLIFIYFGFLIILEAKNKDIPKNRQNIENKKMDDKSRYHPFFIKNYFHFGANGNKGI